MIYFTNTAGGEYKCVRWSVKPRKQLGPVTLDRLAVRLYPAFVSSSEASPTITGIARGQARPSRPRGVTPHPLGPLLYRVAGGSSHRVRVRAGAVFAGSAALLLLAALLKPDPSGLGTHRQLGFPGCGLVITTGIPCPTCGMTTAFAHAVRGRVLRALAAQPFGALMALATLTLAALSLAVIATGKAWWINWYRLSPALVVAATVVVFGAAWAYKVAVMCLAT